MNCLLDTDVFTFALLDRHGIRQRILDEQRSGEVSIAIVTRIEVLQGRFASIVKAADGTQLQAAIQRLHQTERFLDAFPVLDFDSNALQLFDRFRRERKYRKIGRNDLLIACLALARQASLVTRNVKDFQVIPGLQIANWVP
jgi:predicted nucleic acid-binding protein